MTRCFPRHFARHALVLGAAFALAPAALAQTGPDLWSIPDSAPTQGVQSDTSALDMRAIDKTRALADAKLKSLTESGLMTARINDLSAYSDETVAGLGKILEEDSDPCTQAVRAAVYLDGHIEEADWTEVARGIERPWELAGEIALDQLIPDMNDVLTDLFSKLTVIDKALDAYGAYQKAKQHYAQTQLVRDGIAANDIVQEAARGNWTEAEIQQKRAALMKEAQSGAEEMLRAQEKIKEGLEAVDKRYDEKVQIAYYELKRDIGKVYGTISDRDLDMLMANGKFPNLKMSYDDKIRAAGNERAKDHESVVERSYALMHKTQFATERALAQVDALARYSAPLARGDCADIRRDGPIAKPVKKPDTVSEVLKLPHDKLMIFLEKIGSKPSEAMLNCVCRAAGYGSPGTAQMYHPDTLGTYDKRYSCQHPGDPCIVSGYGCTRHPLPSDKRIWDSCAASTGEDITGAITAAVKARQAKSAP